LFVLHWNDSVPWIPAQPGNDDTELKGVIPWLRGNLSARAITGASVRSQV